MPASAQVELARDEPGVDTFTGNLGLVKPERAGAQAAQPEPVATVTVDPNGAAPFEGVRSRHR